MPAAPEKVDLTDSLLRYLRAAIGIFLIALISTSFLIPHVLAVSGKSIVNAKLEWIRTPINGQVSFANLRIGDAIAKGDVLGVVANMRAEDTLLNSLQLEKSALESAIFALDKKQQQLKDHRQQLTASVEQSLLQVQEQTKRKIQNIETEIQTTETKKIQLESKIERYVSANRKFSTEEPYSIVSRATLDDLRNQLNDVEASVYNQNSALELLSTDLRLALSGEFSSKSAPVELQKLKDVQRQISAVVTEQQTFSLKLENLESDITARTASLDLIRKEEFSARIDGIVWDIGYADESYVNNGDSLVAIADTNSLVIECIFHQRYLDDISVGHSATINLMGSDEKLTGYVSKVLIRDPVQSSNLSAFQFSSPASNEFKVLISLDAKQESTPRIGQRAKVVISENKNSVLSKLLLAVSR